MIVPGAGFIMWPEVAAVPVALGAYVSMDSSPLTCLYNSVVSQGPNIAVVPSPKVAGAGAVSFPAGYNDTINIVMPAPIVCAGDFTLSVYVNFRTAVSDWKGIVRGSPLDIRGSYFWLNCQILGGANLVHFPVWAANTWYKITVLRASGVIKMYLDSDLVASSVNSNPLTFQAWELGKGTDLGSGTEKLNGFMDEFVFNPTTAIVP
jgi:hypothetical protein